MAVAAARARRRRFAFRAPAGLARRDPDLYSQLAATVVIFRGMPSDDSRTPPPHSTGAAIDPTLQDESGNELDMGCPIDETTERAWPDFYADATAAGFTRHANEWWHFSRGGQMAAFANGEACAIDGRAA